MCIYYLHNNYPNNLQIAKYGDFLYTGITKQSLNSRLKQHNATGKEFSLLDPQEIGLTRNQARAIEQYYIENGPNDLNKINSISPNNKYYEDAMKWATVIVVGPGLGVDTTSERMLYELLML